MYYNSESNRYINLKETISFSPDVIIADAINPMVFTEGNNEIASSIEIISAYPNPFNPITSIDYYLSSSEEIVISVYDIMGRKISVLDNELKHSGYHTVVWDAANEASGVYYVQISTGEQVQTQKVMLIK